MGISRPAIILALLACSACAVRKPAFQTYRLIKQDSGPVLIPPGVSSPDVAQRTLASDVAGHSRCRSDAGVIGNSSPQEARPAFREARHADQAAARWLNAWAAEIEAQGCIRAGDRAKLADRVAESLPLDPNAARILAGTRGLSLIPTKKVAGLSEDARILGSGG